MSEKRKFTITQQWDYFTKDWPELKNEDYMKYCADHGVTSLQSYVYWASIEKKRGVYSFDFYDDILSRMTKHGLKWVPFIIAGPDYATPDWFHDSPECLYAKCLEHGKESRIQSIWNPNILKYVEPLIGTIAEHFDHDAIESVLIGISGNWGESMYPVNGGFNFNKRPFHTHLGWWCGDDYARADFRSLMVAKYGDLATLNGKWGTNYDDISSIDLPSKRELLIQKYTSKILSVVRYHYDGALIDAADRIYLKYQLGRRRGAYLQQLRDFTDWYMLSMNAYLDKWLSITRRHFLNNNIYVVTGGDGNPMIGVDFTEQVKIAKKYDAGIRITNQTDDSSENYAMTRWTATAARHYGSYFTTEEALYSSYDGIKTRLYDAVTNGADGIYYKTIMDCSLSDDCELKIRGKGAGGRILKNSMHMLEGDIQRANTALLLPTTTIRCIPYCVNHIYRYAMNMKNDAIMDFLCETMIDDGYLDDYSELIISQDANIRNTTMDRILKWQNDGGKVLNGRGAKLYMLDDHTMSLIPNDFHNLSTTTGIPS